MDEERKSPSRVLVIVGAAIIGAGLVGLMISTGVLPVWVLGWWDRLRWPITLVLIGAAVIALALGGIRGPVPGSRLYRSREDRWVAGVLAGLGHYLGIDPNVLRLGFVALVVLGFGWAVIAYLIMAFVVPADPGESHSEGVWHG